MPSSDHPADPLHGHMAAMDDTDRQIVEALRTDGRMSMRALADRIHVSRASAYARVARLEREAPAQLAAAIPWTQAFPCPGRREGPTAAKHSA